MSDNANPSIFALRKIGWSTWDPINIHSLSNDAYHGAADEYDVYLRKIAADLRRGGSIAEATKYLLHIEREYMRLGTRPGQKQRAEMTVKAIRNLVSASD